MSTPPEVDQVHFLKKLSQESFPDMPEPEEEQSDPQEQMVPPVALGSLPKNTSPPQKQLVPENTEDFDLDDEDYGILEDIDESQFEGM